MDQKLSAKKHTQQSLGHLWAEGHLLWVALFCPVTGLRSVLDGQDLGWVDRKGLC